MADPVRCSRCGLFVYIVLSPKGTSVELTAKPNPAGCWAIDSKGVAQVAVLFRAGKIVGRAPGFERATILQGHYADCGPESAKRAQAFPGRKAGVS